MDLPALSIDPYGIGLKQQAMQAEGNLASFKLDQAKKMAPLDEESANLDLQAKRREGIVQTEQLNNDIIGQVVRDTQAADPDQAQQVWDDGMRKAQEKGASAAGQYVGRYRPDLAERLSDYYGAARTGGAGGQRQSAVDAKADEIKNQAIQRQVAQMPSDQVVMSLQKANKVIDSFNKVKDQQTWNDELEYLKSQGMDVDKILPSTDYSALNYAMVKQRIKESLMPYRDALADRAMVEGIGAKAPAPPQLGKSTFVGTRPDGTPDAGRPVYHNPDDNTDTVGQYEIEPKGGRGTSDRQSDFQFRVAAFKRNGMSDTEAIQAAKTSSRVPPERLRAIATQEANKALADLSLANETIKDPQAWLRAKTDEIYAQLSAASEQPMPAPGGARGGPSQAAMQRVKDAGGGPVRFNNGQIWKMKNGRPIRIK